MINPGSCESPIAPQLNPDRVRVFLAEGDSARRQEVITSLTEIGLGHSVTIAKTDDEAERFVQTLQPHALASNVLVFGEGSASNKPARVAHGVNLARTLYDKYSHPLLAVSFTAKAAFRELGLRQPDVDAVVNYQALYDIAARQLWSEALLVGISSEPEGKISHIAQIPRMSPHNVGPAVFTAVVPRKVRAKAALERQRS